MKDILDGLPEINSLSRDEENALAAQPSEENFNKLVLHNMREAFFYARQCCRGKLLADEVYSANYEALLHAAKNFKPNQIRFFAYAKPYIRGGLSQVWRAKSVVRNKCATAPPGRHKWNDNSKVDLGAASEASHEDENENSDGLTGILLRRNGVYQPLIPSKDPEMEMIQLREEHELLMPLFKQLTDKEQSVMALRYKSEMAFARIGKLLGTSRADIQVTHARALKKLRILAREKLELLNR